MVDKRVSAALQQMNKEIGHSRADTGEGSLGVWPPEGDHECYITRIETKNDDDYFVSKSTQGMVTQAKCSTFRFWYQLTKDPNNPDQPMEFGGAPFQIVYNLAEVTDSGKRQQLEIGRNRLAGHLKTITGKEVGGENGIGEDVAMDEAMTKVGGDTQVIVTVRCQYREGKKRPGANPDAKAPTYKTEFLIKLLSD